MDSNKPSHWQVIETRTGKVKADFLTHDQALAFCNQIEPHPDTTGFQYVMQPVRSS